MSREIENLDPKPTAPRGDKIHEDAGDAFASSTTHQWSLARGGKYKGVIIVGKDHNDALNIESIGLYKEAADRGYLVIGDPSREMDLEEIQRALYGNIDEHTRIDIMAHGAIIDGQHWMDHRTYETLRVINDCSTTPKHIHIHSCYGGLAAKDIEVLTPGSFLACHASEDQYRFGTLPPSITKLLLKEPMPSVSEVMLQSFDYEVSNDASFAYKRMDGSTHIEKFKLDVGEIASADSLSLLVQEKFQKFFIAFDEKLPTTIFGDMPEKLSQDFSILSYLSEDKTKAQKLLLEIIKKTIESGLSYLVLSGNLDRFLSTLGPKEVSFLNDMVPIISHLYSFKVSDSNPIFNVSTVNKLIKFGFNVDLMDNTGWTALHRAIFRMDMPIIEALIKAGANVNLADKSGFNPIHSAICKNNMPALEALIKAGANVDLADKDGFTPIHRAIYEKNISILEVLIKAGADINLLDKQGISPLYRAIYEKNMPALAMLIEAGADTTALTRETKQSFIFDFAKNGYDRAIKIMFSFPDININQADKMGETPLMHALKANNIKIAANLIKAGADINVLTQEKKQLLFSHFAKNGYNKAIKIMLSLPDINVNHADEKGKTALMHAVKNNKIKVAKTLLEAGADPFACNNRGKSVIAMSMKKTIAFESSDLIVQYMRGKEPSPAAKLLSNATSAAIGLGKALVDGTHYMLSGRQGQKKKERLERSLGAKFGKAKSR